MSDDLVWVDAWQMQCCGEPFAAGDTVRWALLPASGGDLATVLGPASAEVRWVEEHHSEHQDSIAIRTGIVGNVEGVWCRSEPTHGGLRNEFHLVAEGGVRAWVEIADGQDEPRGEAGLAGYLVSLRMLG